MDTNTTLDPSSMPLFDNFTELNTTEDLSGSNTSVISPGSGGSGAGRGGGSFFIPWDNPLNVMTKEMSDDITDTLQCYVFPIVTAFGIVGNVISLIVLLQKRLRNSTTSIVLIGLAISDVLFLITNMVRKSSCIIEQYDEMLAARITAYSFFYMFYLKTSFSRVSTFIVVLISFERLIAVALPLKVKTIVTKTRMGIAVIFLYVLVFGSLAGLPPQYTHTYIRGKPYISNTKFALDNQESLKIYNEYFLPIVFRYIPVLVVLFVNIAIIILVNRSKRFQMKQTTPDPKRKDEQKKITRMLLTVAIIYLICLLPGDLLLFVSLFIEGFQYFGTYHNLFVALSDICLLFEMINSSVNFITYMVLNRNFFDTYVRLFCGCYRYVSARREMSTSGSSRKTKETSVAAKWRESLKGIVSDSGIDDAEKSQPEMSRSENEPSEIRGQVNEAYVQ